MHDEGAFIAALTQHPEHLHLRSVYADWLEEHGQNDKAEFLRLTVVLHEDTKPSETLVKNMDEAYTELGDAWAETRRIYQERRDAGIEQQEPYPHQTPEGRRREEVKSNMGRVLQRASQKIWGKDRQHKARKRLQELAAGMDTKWLAVVSDPVIEGCGHSQNKGPWRLRLRFDFLCNKRWSEFTPTDDPNVRHCDGCNQNVHFCETLYDARRHAGEQHCIAVDVGVIRRDDKGGYDADLNGHFAQFGQPSKESQERNMRIGLDVVSADRLRQRGIQPLKEDELH